MAEQISPCAECEHHLFGLPKTCDKCYECEKRILYVEVIKWGKTLSRFDERDERELSSYVKKQLTKFEA